MSWDETHLAEEMTEEERTTYLQQRDTRRRFLTTTMAWLLSRSNYSFDEPLIEDFEKDYRSPSLQTIQSLSIDCFSPIMVQYYLKYKDMPLPQYCETLGITERYVRDSKILKKSINLQSLANIIGGLTDYFETQEIGRIHNESATKDDDYKAVMHMTTDQAREDALRRYGDHVSVGILESHCAPGKHHGDVIYRATRDDVLGYTDWRDYRPDRLPFMPFKDLVKQYHDKAISGKRPFKDAENSVEAEDLNNLINEPNNIAEYSIAGFADCIMMPRHTYENLVYGKTKFSKKHFYLLFHLCLWFHFDIKEAVNFFHQCEYVQDLEYQDMIMANTLALFLDFCDYHNLDYIELCLYVFLFTTKTLPDIIMHNKYWNDAFDEVKAELEAYEKKEALHKREQEKIRKKQARLNSIEQKMKDNLKIGIGEE